MSDIAILDMSIPALVSVALKDKEGEIHPADNLITELINSIQKKLEKDTAGTIRNRTYPLAACITTMCCDTVMNRAEADLVLHTAPIRDAIILSALVGMYMMSALDKRELKINTKIQKLSKNEADQTRRRATAASVLAQTAPLGLPGYAAIGALLNAGILLPEDLDDLQMSQEMKEKIEKFTKQLGEKTDPKN
jgi:hypothetical protein